MTTPWPRSSSTTGRGKLVSAKSYYRDKVGWWPRNPNFFEGKYWDTPTYKNGNPKITKKKSNKKFIILRDGPMDGNKMRREFSALTVEFTHDAYAGWYYYDHDTDYWEWYDPRVGAIL